MEVKLCVRPGPRLDSDAIDREVCSPKKNWMRKLVLVKHSLPDIDPVAPSREWRLSDTGRALCETLADALAEHHLTAVVTSSEPKAIETGRIVADKLGVESEVSEGLQEHDRSNVGFLGAQEFEDRIEEFFATDPGRPVFGKETAEQANRRFANVIDTIVEAHADGNLAVVTHGTVMALFLHRVAGVEPLPEWKRFHSLLSSCWPCLSSGPSKW